VRLSRDANRAVVQVPAGNDKLWLLDMEQANATRLTSGGGNDTDGVLSPDGRFLLFVSDRDGGGYRFYRMPLDGRAPAERLLDGEGRIHSISYRSRMLGFSLVSAPDGFDAYVMAVAEDGTPAGKPVLVAGGPNNQTAPSVSPDGALVAYQSSEAGRDDIYVARLGDPGSRRRITSDGGTLPLWSRETNRLFYASSSRNRVFSVNVSAPGLGFDAPQMVTTLDVPGAILSYDVALDGTSVLVARLADLHMLRRDIRLWPGWGKTLPSRD
jgi:Tol biopolymer transport system component